MVTLQKALFIAKWCKYVSARLQPFNNLFTEGTRDIYIFLLLCKYVNRFCSFRAVLDLVSVE